MRVWAQFAAIAALCTLIVIPFVVGLERLAARADEKTEPFVRTLAELDRRAERRHGELITRIEGLRRQTLLLHGRRFVEEK